jgi:hypothetical protein
MLDYLKYHAEETMNLSMSRLVLVQLLFITMVS